LAAEGQITLEGATHRPRIQKRYGFSRGRAGFEVSYRLSHEGSGPLKAFFAPELNLTLLAGDAEDRTLELPDGPRHRLTFRGEVQQIRSVSLLDGWSKLRIKLSAERPFDLWTYPVETVSQSDGGFERIYQGSCLLLRIPIELPPGGSIDLSYELDLEHLA
jgi:alpha-amylase